MSTAWIPGRARLLSGIVVLLMVGAVGALAIESRQAAPTGGGAVGDFVLQPEELVLSEATSGGADREGPPADANGLLVPVAAPAGVSIAAVAASADGVQQRVIEDHNTTARHLAWLQDTDGPPPQLAPAAPTPVAVVMAQAAPAPQPRPTPAAAAPQSQPQAAAKPTSRGSRPARKVGLQVGHWRYWEMPYPLNASGTAGGGKSESEVNLEIARRAAAILRGQGYVVDVLPANIPRGYRADAVVAIHADGSSSTARRGFFVDRPARSVIAGVEERFRLILVDTYAAATGLSYVYRGTPDSQYYYGYSRVTAQTPMVLVEGGFLTNAQDRTILVGQPDKVAKGIANGIVRFLGQ